MSFVALEMTLMPFYQIEIAESKQGSNMAIHQSRHLKAIYSSHHSMRPGDGER